MGTTNSNSTFNREERYTVFKKKDIYRYLLPPEQAQLWRLLSKVDRGRLEEFRGRLDCVVVEHDWPEAEIVWSMIEARMTGGVNFVDWQASQVVELQRKIAELEMRLGSTEERTNAE